MEVNQIKSKKKYKPFDKTYKLVEYLGEGKSSLIMKGIHKVTGNEFAVKIIDKAKLNADESLALSNELEIMRQIDHPNSVKLYEIYEENEKLHLIMEYLSGGELIDRILEKESYSEKEASDAIRPVIDCIKYCHSMGIVHRDLRPEKLLYSSKNDDSVIKIADFGLARFFDHNLMKTSFESTNYMAPEILKGSGYTCAVDCWSIGAIIYLMLSGNPPFLSDNQSKMNESIMKCQYDISSSKWKDISILAKDFIKRTLIFDPKKRLNAADMLVHPWILGEKTPRNLLKFTANNLKGFLIKRKVKRIANVIIASKRMEMIAQKGFFL